MTIARGWAGHRDAPTIRVGGRLKSLMDRSLSAACQTVSDRARARLRPRLPAYAQPERLLLQPSADERQIEAANQLTGGAQRRKAWQYLDVDLLRRNPPMAPLYHPYNGSFVSKSFGCFLFHPLYGVDITAACKK